MAYRKSLIFLLFLFFSCQHIPPNEQVSWHFKGIEKEKIPGKCLRVWEKRSCDSSSASFLVLEVLKGMQMGKFHIGFLIERQALGPLIFYEYDQRQEVDVKVNAKLCQGLSLRRIKWDAQRDFIGLLNQGSSAKVAQEIYKGLLERPKSFVIELTYSCKQQKITHHFELADFQKDRESELAKQEKYTGGGT